MLEEDLLKPRPLEDQVLDGVVEQRLQRGDRGAAHEQRHPQAVRAHEIWTHKIDGLTESDFVFAAKCDRLFQG